MDDNDSKPLTVSSLGSTPAITTLGLIASRLLQQTGIVAFQVLTTGAIVVVPPRELELDSLPEPEALQLLVADGYTDQQLSSYLEARDSRLSRTDLAPVATPVESSEDDHR